MNQLVANFVGWLASLLFITAASVLWGFAAMLVWLSGNGTMPARVAQGAK